MDKLNLLEKLKTLKQWQLEQQLDFENLKSEYDCSSENPKGEMEEVNHDENKENEAFEASGNQKVTQQMFMDRIPPNILAQALKQASLNSDTASSPMDLKSSTIKSNNNTSTNHTLMNSHSNTLNNVAQVSNYSGINQLQTLDNRQIMNLSNWHTSGMQTVLFQDNLFHQGSIQNEITPIKPSPNSKRVMTNYECSESEDGFSESDPQEEMDGFTPLSDTEEEDYFEGNGFENEDDFENRNGIVSSGKIDSSGIDEHDFFIEENETTVIQMNIPKVSCFCTNSFLLCFVLFCWDIFQRYQVEGQ